MFKRTVRKILGIVLCLSIVASAAAIGGVSVKANILLDYAVTKLLDTGMRVCSECTGKLAQATGNAGFPGAESGLSFINDWVFTDGSDKAMQEIKELCQDILAELDIIEQEMTESFAQIQSVMAQSEVRLASSRVDEKWSDNVDSVFRDAKAVNALAAYKTYLGDAAYDRSDEVLEKDLENLIKAYSQMYGGTIPIDKTDTESLKAILFLDAGMNNTFVSLITNLADGLNYDNISSGSVALYASQFAYQAYPFSHQQYQYLHSIMEKQILQVILAEMMYNEYLYQQGRYFAEVYGEESAYYESYLRYQKSFYELMTEGDSSVNSRIGKMLEAKMNVDGVNKVYLSLSDYMRPEDAVSVRMKISGYESSHDFKKDIEDAFSNEGILANIRDKSNISYAKYIKEYVYFRRVMTHTASGNNVFYIIDPDQFDSPEALSLSSLDNCVDLGLQMDIHSPTCDYVNLMREMSDGTNTYQALCDLTCDDIDPLFATNAFSLRGDTINTYLNDAVEYLPKLTSNGGTFKNCYIITPMYRYSKYAALLYTSYVQYKAFDGSKLFTGGNLSLDSRDEYDEIDMGTNQKSKDVAFSVILSNTGSEFISNLSAKVNGGAGASLSITSEDSDQIIHSNESMNVAAGKKLTIKMYLNGEEPLSLELIRNGSSTEKTEILTAADFESVYDSNENCYILEYTMPYSDSQFVLNTNNKTVTVKANRIMNGQISFSPSLLVPSEKHKPGDTVTCYITQNIGYGIDSITVTDSDGNTLPKDKIVITDHCLTDDNKSQSTVQFAMPETDATVSAVLVKGTTVMTDTDAFIKDDDGNYTSYLLLIDPVTEEPTMQPVLLPESSDFVRGNIVTGKDYKLESITIKTMKKGTVVYYGEFSEDDDSFSIMIDHRSDMEDYIVVPSFIKKTSDVDPDREVHKRGIRTYEELAEFARLVDEEYDNYGDADVWLENNIKVPDGTEWEKGIGSVSENKPFTGTFDGKGYVIHGLNVSGEEYSGLFEYIGEGGTVKDLAIMDGVISSPNGVAGGIAALNEGTIDHCVVGINTDTIMTFKTKNGNRVRAADLGLTVYGSISGGIAGINKGSIVGTRNRSYVIGQNCAGIAGENYGNIISCANNGPIGKNSSEIKKAAGITAENYGIVFVTYNSGKITGSNKTKCAYLTLESHTGDMTSFYYADNSGHKVIPDDSLFGVNDSMKSMTLTEMQTQAFVDVLGGDPLNTATWILPYANNTYFNQGLPIIQGSFLQQTTIDAGSNVTVSGMMHPAMQVAYNKTELDTDAYSAAAEKEGGRVSAVYGVTLSTAGNDSPSYPAASLAAAIMNNENGDDFVPTELWCAGVTICVPVETDDAKILCIDEDGNAHIFTPDSIENGVASFNAAQPVSFAVVESKAAPAPTPDDDNVPTGDTTLPITAAAAVMVSALIMIFAWRKRNES